MHEIFFLGHEKYDLLFYFYKKYIKIYLEIENMLK